MYQKSVLNGLRRNLLKCLQMGKNEAIDLQGRKELKRGWKTVVKR